MPHGQQRFRCAGDAQSAHFHPRGDHHSREVSRVTADFQRPPCISSITMALPVGAIEAFIDSPDRLSEFYRDDAWLAANPLNEGTVLLYMRHLGLIDPSQSSEYAVRPMGADAQTLGLFVVERLLRRSPTEATVQSVYYCLHGTLYQCPDLGTLLSARIERVSYHLAAATQALEAARASKAGAAAGSAGAAAVAAADTGAAAARLRPVTGADISEYDRRPDALLAMVAATATPV